VTTVEQADELRQQDATRARKTPYQGLLPYTEEDADYFFGRTTWCGIITDHLLAYRVTLLYGPSGVGKSSVLRAGVGHGLFKIARQNLELLGQPELLPTIVSSWSGDPVAGVDAGLRAAAVRVWPSPPPDTVTGSLAEIVSGWAGRAGGRVLLMLDQFDEYFMYHETRPGGLAFVDALSDLIADRAVAVNVLISIREDALAKLDRFDDPSVDMWQNLLRIDHLDADAAREAIGKPIARWNERDEAAGEKVTLEPKLVDAVVTEANARAVRIGNIGRGLVDSAEPEPAGGSVEAPYLQLVMTRLWEEERRRGSSILHLDTLNRLGGAEQIARRHFDEVMRTLPRRRRNRAAKLLEYLVTPAGTKIALPPSALAKWSKQKEEKITPVLATLAGGEQRILRTVSSPGDTTESTSYEIFHDRLAEGILDWRRRYVRRRRGIRAAALVLAVVVAAASAGAVVIYRQHLSNERLAQNLHRLELEQQRKFRQDQKNAAARAVKSPFFAAMLPSHHDSVTSADFGPRGHRVATASLDNSVIVANAATGRQLHVLRPDVIGGITRVVFSQRGDAIGVETGEGWGGIWNGVSPNPRFRLDAGGNFNSLTFTGDGRTVVAASSTGSADLWDVPSGKRLAVFGRVDHQDTVTISADGRLVAASGQSSIQVWDVRSHTLRTRLRIRRSPADIRFTRDGSWLLAVAPHRAVLWNTRTWHAARLGGAPPHIASFDDGGFPDLDRLADISRDKIVIAGTKDTPIWSFHGRRLATLRHTRPTTVARFSPGGGVVATGTDDGTVQLWSSDGRRLAVLLRGAGYRVESLAFERDGSRLVSAGDDGTSFIWKLESDLAVTARVVAEPAESVVTVRVTNAGVRSSKAARLRVSASDGAVAYAGVRRLAAGATETVSVVLPRRGPGADALLIRVAAVPADRRADARHDNNEATLAIPPPPG
jgi:WD40 repeat protein